MAERRLVSTERIVLGADVQRYEQAWVSLRTAATAAGVRAWRYRAAGDPSLFVEFLEYGGGDDSIAGSAMQRARADLEVIARGEAKEWRDATAALP